MWRLFARCLALLSILAVAACGITSDYDIGQKLKPQTPLLAGTYRGDDKDAKPAKITRAGDSYALELTDDKGHTARGTLRFFQIAEFDGYVMQLIDPEKPGQFFYLFTRVTPAGIELLDENIDNAALPPDLERLFNQSQPTPGQTLYIKTRTLKRGADVLFVLQALASGKFPMTRMDYLKRME
jgi:hypothetical protein